MKRGIIPEYFIKPDPLLTRQETRHYIRASLRSFLTGPALLRDAAALLALVSSGAVVAPAAEDLKAGLWPVGRLVALARLLETEDLADVGAVALAICQSHLDVSEDIDRIRDSDQGTASDVVSDVASDVVSDVVSDAASDEESPAVTETESLSQENAESAEINHVALGFILTDLLSNGKTIRPYWDHSPFRALRTAPPLGSTASPFFAGSARPSLDDLLEAFTERACNGFYTVCTGVGLAIPAVLIGYIMYRVL